MMVYFLQIGDSMTQIISSIVEECQHGGSDEFWTIFH